MITQTKKKWFYVTVFSICHVKIQEYICRLSCSLSRRAADQSQYKLKHKQKQIMILFLNINLRKQKLHVLAVHCNIYYFSFS